MIKQISIYFKEKKNLLVFYVFANTYVCINAGGDDISFQNLSASSSKSYLLHIILVSVGIDINAIPHNNITVLSKYLNGIDLYRC